MASARDIAVKRGETVNYYRPDQFVIRPELNARDLSTPDNVAHVEWLANEMRDKGFTSILKCMMWEGALVLTEGHCRTTAVKLCIERGWLPADTLVPALTEPKGTSIIDLYARQVSGNGTSKALNPAELAANTKRMMTVGKTLEDVAKLVGKSKEYLDSLLTLEAEAPTEVLKLVADGTVSVGTAERAIKKLGKTEGAKQLVEAAAEAKAKGQKKVSGKGIAPKPKRLNADTIETMVSILREIAAGHYAQAMTKAQAVIDKIDGLRGE